MGLAWQTTEWIFYGASALVLYNRFFIVRKRRMFERYEPVDEAKFATIHARFQQHIPYFQSLSTEGKRRFINRALEISDSYDLQGWEDFELTDEVKDLIAGCLAQLTFGFKEPGLDSLQSVAVFPDIFHSRLADADVKGLATGNGRVYLSWKHFLEGYSDTRDTYNLGLHEFAHVLRLEALSQEANELRINAYFENWQQHGYPVFMRLKQGKDHLFRDYGGVNQAEFFSVCVENFFEVPEQFQLHEPELYYLLCQLLHQDPMNTANDYAFDAPEVVGANKQFGLNINPYHWIYSNSEWRFWRVYDRLFMLPLLIGIGQFSSMAPHKAMAAFRMTCIVFLLVLLFRWLYYQNAKAMTSAGYWRHVLFRLSPMLAFVAASLQSLADR